MVKGLVWVAILGSMAVAILMGVKMMNADSGELVGIAIAPPSNGTVQLQVLTPMLMTKLDGPRLTGSGEVDWDGWIASHYDLRDAQNNKLTLTRLGFTTPQIREAQAGTAEFILGATLTQGQPYTLEVTPIVGEPKKYIHRFTAEPQDFKRLNFLPNY